MAGYVKKKSPMSSPKSHDYTMIGAFYMVTTFNKYYLICSPPFPTPAIVSCQGVLLYSKQQCYFGLPHPQWPFPPVSVGPKFSCPLYPKYVSPLSTSYSHSCSLSLGSHSIFPATSLRVFGALPWNTGPQGEQRGRANPLCPTCNTTVSAKKQPPWSWLGDSLPKVSRVLPHSASSR